MAKQATWVGIGAVVMVAATLIDYRWIKWAALPLYLVGIIGVILTYQSRAGTWRARCWLKMPGIELFRTRSSRSSQECS